MRNKLYIALLIITLILPCNICKAQTLELIGQGAIYNPLPNPSNNNALQAAKQINNKIVNPGEVFSFYDYVLPSAENGYQEGLSMYQTSRGTEYYPDIGGGICKTATALNFAVQNAGLDAGLEVVEIHHHTSAVSYAVSGQDVAVSRSAGWDYKFRNTLDRPISITGIQEGKYLTIKLYSQGIIEQEKPNPIFPDQNLERAIRDTLNKASGELLPEDLLSIKELYLYRKNISSLEGLEKLKNLEILEASGNNIADISPVAGLSKLHTLCLGANQISDIESLENLVKLKHLELFNNSISNIEALKDLQFKKLYLDNNQISDISCLQNLSDIKILSLSGNKISRVGSLNRIRKAEQINLANNQVANIRSIIDVLNYNKNLNIDLRGNRVKELPPIKKNSNVLVELKWDFADLDQEKWNPETTVPIEPGE